MNIELKPIDDLRPYERDLRKSDDAIDPVAKSLKEFGFRQPIVTDEHGVIIVGRVRWLAAKQLGLTVVPVHVARELTPEQARAYRIADNETNRWSEWDMSGLPLELGELKDLDFDISLLGFDEDEISRLLKALTNEGECDPDDMPQPSDTPVARPGDLFVMGNHRLLVGDSGSVANVDRLIDGATIHMVNCDPPYNVNVEPRSNNAIANSKSSSPGRTHHQAFDEARRGGKKRTTTQLRAKDRPLVNDFVSEKKFEDLLQAWFGNIARVLKPGGAFYIWGGYANCANYPPVLKACKLYFSQSIIWHKQHPVLSRKDFMGDHEWAFYGWREGARHRYRGPKNATDVWSIQKVSPQKMVHLTEKPVELAARAIQYSSLPGENVLDLFGGSGSTLIAAEQLGRCAYLMECDCMYADIIVARWEKFSSRKAQRVPAETPVAAEVLQEAAA